MYPTWLKRTTRTWTAALLLLATVAAVIGGAQNVAAQPAAPAATNRQTRVLLPLMLNRAASAAEPVVAFAAEASPTGATVTTDLADYPPGATVTVTGAGWAPGEAVDIFVNDSGGQTWSLHSDPDPVANLAGTFTYQFQLPTWFVANYAVLATGTSSGSATTTFTDVSIGLYDQCSNDQGTGYPSGDTGCRWTNGNLQSNNSAYTEGDATVQRVWLTDYTPGSSHTVTFKYGTTKGGKHAYDFLTTWNWSEGWITVADRCQGITGCTTVSSESTLDIPQDPNVPNTFEPTAPGARQFVMRGGTLTSATTPAIVSGTYGGDSETAITVSFTVANSGAMCSTKQGVTTCSVALWFGGHVATQSDWGIGTAAGNISGSPYHVALDATDGTAVGQRDNQMQASAVVPNGTIVIVKDAVPNDAQDFNFNLTNGATINQNFQLDDDSDATLPNSQTFSVPPGTWSASEVFPLPATWALTNLVCVDPTSNTTVNVGTGIASINLASAETVSCTFTNSRDDRGSLRILKTLSNPDGAAVPASFTVNYDCGTGYTGSVSVAAGGSATVSNIPTGRSCTVSEATLAPIAGYTWGTPVITGSPATIGKNTTVDVTVANSITRDQGYLKLSKVFNSLTSGFAGPFSVVYNCGAGNQTVNLTAGATTTVGPFAAGTSCTVTEPTLPTAPAGWTFGTPVITGSPATIVKGDQAAAVSVTVTNSISRDQGYLKIGKVFDPKTSGFTGTFAITYNCGAGDQTVNVAAGGSTTVGPFPTGTSCTVGELTLPTAPTGWTFGAPVVSGSPATIVKGDQAAAVSVTVTNSISQDQGYFKISKAFDPKTSGFTGTFAVVYNCGAGDQTVNLAAGSWVTVGPFATGTSCAVTEPALSTAPLGWTFGTPVITGSPATIGKDTTVEATVTNSISRDQGYLKISKAFDPKTSGFAGTFAIAYNCGAGSQTVNLAAGGSTTVGPFDTGTSCAVTEPTLPTAPAGWTFGTPVISGSPAIIVKGIQAAPIEVTVTNTITRDPGYLKISKAFDPKTSGFTGTFAVVYNCGAGDQTVDLLAGASTTVGPFDTGTSCTVSEPTLPTAPLGWTFGSPVVSGSPATIVKGDQAAAVSVTVTNSISRDLGYLRINKAFDPQLSGFTGTFAIVYNCGAGDQTVDLAAGASTTVGPFPTGTSCTVSEPVLPTAPANWTFGTPIVTGSPAIIGKDTTVEATVTNSISRDQGYLKISKAFDAQTSGFSGTFDIVYNCGTGDQIVNLAAGGSTTVGPFDTGTSCSVSEPLLPTAPAGWTFGTPVISGNPATIAKGDQAAAVSVTVTNSISRDQGYLRIDKLFDPQTSGFTGEFAIVYNCGAGDQTVNLPAGGWITVGPIPTGTSCTVSEPVLPAAPAEWAFSTPIVTGSPAIIVAGDSETTVNVTVTNNITRDRGSLAILKTVSNPDGATLPASFTMNYDCGPGYADQVNVIPGIPAMVSSIPTGSICTVSEAALAPISGYTWGTPVITGSPATIGKDTTVDVTVANSITLDRGSLRILKTLSNPDGAAVPASFTVNYDCGAGNAGSVAVAAGGSATVSSIPTGSICTVSEAALAPIAGYTWGTPIITGSPATIGKDTTVDVAVANSIAHMLGSLQVTKIVNWNGAVPDAASTFQICITGPSFANGDCKVAGYTGGVLTWNGLVPGAYTVAETDPGNAWQVTVDSANVTVPSNGGQAQATVTNTKLADPRITVTKIVTQTSQQQWSFVLRLDGDRRTVSNEQPQAAWENLEPNRTYTLSEDEPGAGWAEGSFECKVNGVSVGEPLPGGDLQLSVVPGDDVSCVKYNTDLSGTDLDPMEEPGTVFGLFLPAITR